MLSFICYWKLDFFTMDMFIDSLQFVYSHAYKLGFPKQQILDFSKLKDFADDNFEFDENGRKFSWRVENTVGGGEISRNEQFLLFQQCFQKTCTTNT